MEGKFEEGLIKGAKPSKLLKDTNLKYMIDYICKISGKIVGTGFFCKIKYDNELIPVLMTNYHVLDDNYIKDHKQINIYINNNMKIIKIYTDSLIYSSDNNKYDIIIIKIKNDNEITNYLEIEENIFRNNAEDIFKNESIYILHFPNGGEANISYGCGIEKINEYELMHKCNTDSGSSGGPIMNALNNKVIGIHRGYFKKYNYNYGTLLKYPLIELSKKNELRYEAFSKNKKGEIKIFIVDSKNGYQIIYLPSLSITVKELKNLIETKYFTKEFQLVYNGCILEDEEKLDYYDIQENATIIIVGIFAAG